MKKAECSKKHKKISKKIGKWQKIFFESTIRLCSKKKKELILCFFFGKIVDVLLRLSKLYQPYRKQFAKNTSKWVKNEE